MAHLLLTCTEADVSTTNDSLGRGGAGVQRDTQQESCH